MSASARQCLCRLGKVCDGDPRCSESHNSSVPTPASEPRSARLDCVLGSTCARLSETVLLNLWVAPPLGIE